jgi:hypothetical protein
VRVSLRRNLAQQTSPCSRPFIRNRRGGLGATVFGDCLKTLLVWWLAASALVAQEATEVINREPQIKAAYLGQLGRYVEWPRESFPRQDSPFLIGVFVEDSVAANLHQMASTRRVQDRPIEIRKCSINSNLTAFQILFLPADLESKLQAEIVQRTEGHGVLLVGDGLAGLKVGCAISFVNEENKIRLYIARKTIERHGLTVSAKLLQVGHVVD